MCRVVFPLSLCGILARHAGPSLQAAKFAPLLAPRLSCHAVAIRAACLIQQAWLWHVRLYYEDAGCPELDAAGGGAPVTSSGTLLPASCRRLHRAPTLPGGPPFRFLHSGRLAALTLVCRAVACYPLQVGSAVPDERGMLFVVMLFAWSSRPTDCQPNRHVGPVRTCCSVGAPGLRAQRVHPDPM